MCTSPADTQIIFHRKITGSKTVMPPEKLTTGIINNDNQSLNKSWKQGFSLLHPGDHMDINLTSILCADLPAYSTNHSATY